MTPHHERLHHEALERKQRLGAVLAPAACFPRPASDMARAVLAQAKRASGPQRCRVAAPENSKRLIARLEAYLVETFPPLTLDELRSDSRKGGASRARRIESYVARELTGLSYPELGRRFGGRNHATVLVACKQAIRELKVDEDFAWEVALAFRALGSH